MIELSTLDPIDYLLVGHITLDLTTSGKQIGGGVTYSALLAASTGLRVGVVTSWGSEIPLGPMETVRLVNYPTERSTTFENIYTPAGRVQKIYAVAQRLAYYQIPEPWRKAEIIHLAPVAQEVDPTIVRHFSSSLIGVSPQGWMRNWDGDGLVHGSEWPEARFVLERSGAAVISIEDVAGDESRIEEMAASCRVLAVTEGADGVRLFWNGDVRRFRAPAVSVVDPTGAGDIFASAFFIRLYTTRDPWEAARFATQIASISVTRPGLDGIPTRDEIRDCMVEVY
jgi:sugar/nucleoside kinase (ribokinase family)